MSIKVLLVCTGLALMAISGTESNKAKNEPNLPDKVCGNLQGDDKCIGADQFNCMNPTYASNCWRACQRCGCSNKLSDDYCDTMASTGGCEHVGNIKWNCRKSCEICECEDTDNGITNENDQGCKFYNADLNTQHCEHYDDKDFTANTMCCACGGGCSNKVTGGYCESWAAKGHCKKFKKFMKDLCQMSCDFCDEEKPVKPVPSIPKKP